MAISNAVQSDNATYLFEKYKLHESFWTILFTLFILHQKYIKVWQCNDKKPYFIKRSSRSLIKLNTVKFDDLIIQKPLYAEDFSKNIGELPNNLGGLTPDLLITLRQSPQNKYILIENKTDEVHLGWHQKNTYHKLVSYLNNEKNIDIQYFLLVSCCCDKLFADAKILQKNLNDQFGVVLWEDILKQMINAIDFKIPGIDFIELEQYTKALGNEVDTEKWDLGWGP